MRTVDVLLDIEVLGVLDTLRMETDTECSQSVDLHTAAGLEHLVHLEHQGADHCQDVRLGDGTPVADALRKLLHTDHVGRNGAGIPETLTLAVLTVVLIHTILDGHNLRI